MTSRRSGAGDGKAVGALDPAKPIVQWNQYRRRQAPARSDHRGERPGLARRATATALGCLLILAMVLPAGVVPVTHSQTRGDDECRYFVETGHYVCGEFLRYFESRGDFEILGYPLSEPFEDPTHGGLWVQYFQRARLELHPENPVPHRLQLGLLIDELGYDFPPVAPEEIPAPDDPAHHYFPETKHVVSYAFLDNFRAKGGLDIFGYPRSEFTFEGGKVVQYFQRARMEWYRNEPGQPVRLSNVGEMYIERFGIPQQHRAPVVKNRYKDPTLARPAADLGVILLPLVVANADPGLPAETPEDSASPATMEPSAPPATAPSVPVRELQVSASVRYPITGQTGTQTTFIYMDDQEGRPIEGAKARVVIHYPWGNQDCTPQPADAAGFTWCSFEINSPTPGEEVVIDIEVTYRDLVETAQTFFMPWW